MSIHSSLRTPKGAASASRNVLKRHERVRHLLTLGTWAPGQSVLGLPKIKQMRMKVRKAVKEKEAAAGESSTAAAPSASG